MDIIMLSSTDEGLCFAVSMLDTKVEVPAPEQEITQTKVTGDQPEDGFTHQILAQG
jgi:hypothetical protein